MIDTHDNTSTPSTDTDASPPANDFTNVNASADPPTDLPSNLPEEVSTEVSTVTMEAATEIRTEVPVEVPAEVPVEVPVEVRAEAPTEIPTEAQAGPVLRPSVRPPVISVPRPVAPPEAHVPVVPVVPVVPEMPGVPEMPDALAAMTSERDRLKDQLLRTLADFDNHRKRVAREKQEDERRGRERVLSELLPVFDNLERAAAFARPGADPKAIVDGVMMVLKLFEDALTRTGGSRIKAVGQPFDPSQHEALQQIESSEHPAGTVAQELVAGYKLGEKLLRPAMVVVSKGPPPSAQGVPERPKPDGEGN